MAAKKESGNNELEDENDIMFRDTSWTAVQKMSLAQCVGYTAVAIAQKLTQWQMFVISGQTPTTYLETTSKK